MKADPLVDSRLLIQLRRLYRSLELTAEGEIQAVKRDYKGLATTIRKMYGNEGFFGFFRGCVPNAIRVAPGAAITFLVYEAVMDYLD